MAELPIIERYLEDFKRKNNERIKRSRQYNFDFENAKLDAPIDNQIKVRSVSNREVAQQIDDSEIGKEFRTQNEDAGQADLRTYDEDTRYPEDAAASETGQYSDKRVRKLRRHKETVAPSRPSPFRYARLQRGIGKLSGDPNAPLQAPIPAKYVWNTGGMTSPGMEDDVSGRAEARRNYYAEEYKQNVAEGKIEPSDDYDYLEESDNDTQNFNPEDRATYSAINQDDARESLARLKSDLEAGKYGSTIPKEIEILYRDLLRTAYPDYAVMYEQNESANLLAEERASRRQLSRDQMIQAARDAAASSTTQTSSEIVETGYSDTPEGRAELAARLTELTSSGVKARMVSNQNGELGIELVRSTQTPGELITKQGAINLLAALQPGAAAQRTNEKVDLERRARNVEVNQDNQLVNLIRQLRGLKPVTPGAAQRYLANMGDLTTLGKANKADYSLTNTPSDRRALRTEIVDPNVVFVEDEGTYREATAPFNLVQPIEIQPNPESGPQANLRQWILKNYLFADSRDKEGDIFKFDFDSARQSMGSALSELGKGVEKLKTGTIAQIKKLDKQAKQKNLTPDEIEKIDTQRSELQNLLQRLNESSKPQQIFETGVRNLSEVDSLIKGAQYLIARGGGLRKEGGLMRGSKMQPDPDPDKRDIIDIDVALNALGITGDNPQMRRELATSLYMQEMALQSSVNQQQKNAYVTRDKSLPKTQSLPPLLQMEMLMRGLDVPQEVKSIESHQGLIRGAKTGKEPTTLQQLGKEGTFNKDEANKVAKQLQRMASTPVVASLIQRLQQPYGVTKKDFDEEGNLKRSDKGVMKKERAGAARTRREIELTNRDGSKANTRISPESKTRMTGLVQADSEKVRVLSRQLRRAETLLMQAEDRAFNQDGQRIITSELLQAQRAYEALRQQLDAELPAQRQAAFDRDTYVPSSQRPSVKMGIHTVKGKDGKPKVINYDSLSPEDLKPSLEGDQMHKYVTSKASRIMNQAYEENKRITPGELKQLIASPTIKDIPMLDNIVKLFGNVIRSNQVRDRREQFLANEQVRRDRPKQGGTPMEQLNQLINYLQGGVKSATIQTTGKASQTTVPLEVVDGALTLKPAQQRSQPVVTEGAADPAKQARIARNRLRDIEAVSDDINQFIETTIEEGGSTQFKGDLSDIDPEDTIPRNIMDIYNRAGDRTLSADDVDTFTDWVKKEIPNDPVALGEFVHGMTRFPREAPQPAPSRKAAQVLEASGPDVVDQIINKYRAEYEAGGPVNKKGELAADRNEAARQYQQVAKVRKALADDILKEIRSESAPAASTSGALVSLRPSAKTTPEQPSRYYDGNNQYDVASAFSFAQQAAAPSPTPAPSTPKQTSGIPTRPSKNFTPPKKKVEPDPGPSKEYTPPPKRSKDYKPPIRKAGTAVQKEKVDPVKKFKEEQKVKAPTDNKRRQLLYALGALTGGTAIGAGAMALADREEEEQRQPARY